METIVPKISSSLSKMWTKILNLEKSLFPALKEKKGRGYFKHHKLGLPLLLKVDNIPYLVAVSICHCS